MNTLISAISNREHSFSDRLILYRPSADDFQAVFDIHANPQTNHFNPQGPMTTLEEAHGVLAHWQTEWDEKQWGYWSVALRSDPERIIGFGGISNRPRFGGNALVERLQRLHAANLYFRFSPEVWGSGYANEMAEKALDMAFNQIGLKAVLGLTRETNAPSRRALERLGFEFIEMSDDEHALGPQYIYAIDAKTYHMKYL
ncbi:GNAT family N-acetyltransferase [Undibacterium sp. Ji67W]|uniref:GNAT family N-acetyltransferase n=1 Tax=Undibacterium sp. Ji67W TaxID=3413042 RepID=UPI003BF177D1